MGRYGDGGVYGYEDLDVYKAARVFRQAAYDLVRHLPVEERFALGQQMRRAAVSLTSNLAEGYGRHHWQPCNTHGRRAARFWNSSSRFACVRIRHMDRPSFTADSATKTAPTCSAC